MQDTPIQNFLSASQAVVNDAVNAARAADPGDFGVIVAAMRAGAILKLGATFAPLTGQAMMQISVVEPCGNEHLLSQCELYKQKT